MQRTIFVLTLFVGFVEGCRVPEKETPPPNVIVIVADDLGWADLGSYGSSFYETPNLDKLASSGIRFTNAYSTCPVCSPSRSSIQTGRYPVKTKVTDWLPGRAFYVGATPNDRLLSAGTEYQLATEEKTLAEVLSTQGYKTFFAGKWHLGETENFWPEHQGYDYNVGGTHRGAPVMNDTCSGYFSPYCNPRLPDGPDGEYLPERLTHETLKFIEANKNQPFFVSLNYYLVHTPLQANETLQSKYELKRSKLNAADTLEELEDNPSWKATATNSRSYRERKTQAHVIYATMVETLDRQVGEIIQHLEQTGLRDRTMIIFTSDNGGLSTAEGSPTSNLPLRAGKGWLYEGGIRVPFIMSMPGHLEEGRVEHEPVTGADIFPTVMAVAAPEVDDDTNVDGKNILTIDVARSQRPLYWHYPHYSNQGGNPGGAIRIGNYKLIDDFETGRQELYELGQDPGERHDLALELPAVRDSLYQTLVQWRNENGALMMAENKDWNNLKTNSYQE